MKKWTMKGAVTNLVVLALSSLIAFGSAELTVRLLYKDDILLMPRYHTDVRYGEFTLRTTRPNSTFRHTTVDGSWQFVTNAQGFRNRVDFAYAKPDGVLRVICLGDSHTQGHEVRQDHTYSAIIERYLSRQGRSVEVMNTGVSGFSTAEELILLENEGVKYDPDVVVLGFSANDFEDNIKAGLFRLNEDGSLSIQKKEHIPGVRIQNLIYRLPLVGWLSENSYFYSLLFNRVWDFFKARLASDAARAVTEYAIPTTNTVSDYQLQLTAALLRRMSEFCDERGIRLILLDIPRVEGDSALPKPLKDKVSAMNLTFIDSGPLLSKYLGVVELHVPHGARHISEFSHAMLGAAAGEKIESALGPRAPGAS